MYFIFTYVFVYFHYVLFDYFVFCVDVIMHK